MKKILILAYDFPPYNSVGGQRPYAWFKYFNQFAYEPIVVTRHWDTPIHSPLDYICPSQTQHISKEHTQQGIIYRAPFISNWRDRLIIKHGMDKYTLFRKLLTVAYMLTEFVTFVFDNKKTLYACAQKAIQENKPDVIIATGEPFVLFRYASMLSEKYQIPWIADYRDGWSTNYTRTVFEKRFYSIIEKHLLCTASAVTAASSEFAGHIEAVLQRKVHPLLNGYFEEKFENRTATPKHEKFIIGFAGTLYPYQPIELIAEGFKKITDTAKADVLLRFVGLTFYADQMQRIKKAFEGSNIHLEFTDRLPHDEALMLLAQSSILLLPANKNYPQVYAKVFDYLALKRTILLCQSDEGSLKEIIMHTQSGFICNTADEVTDVLHKLYAQWKQDEDLSCNSVHVDDYSRKKQTKKLAEILNKIL